MGCRAGLCELPQMEQVHSLDRTFLVRLWQWWCFGRWSGVQDAVPPHCLRARCAHRHPNNADRQREQDDRMARLSQIRAQLAARPRKGAEGVRQRRGEDSRRGLGDAGRDAGARGETLGREQARWHEPGNS